MPSLSGWADIYGGFQNPTNLDAVQPMADNGGNVKSDESYQPQPVIPWVSIVAALIALRFVQDYSSKHAS